MHTLTHWMLDGWRPNEWMWYFPQFHELIFGMTALAILLLLGIFVMQILNLRRNKKILLTNESIMQTQRKILSLLEQKIHQHDPA